MSQSRRPDSLLLALDEGTTNAKAMLLSVHDGSVIAQASQPLAIYHPKPGSYEQDPTEIINATLKCAERCLEAVDVSRVVGVTISNQRETVVAWDAVTGLPVGPALGWQDSRTSAECHSLSHSADEIRSRTGLILDPMFSAPKMRYLIDVAQSEGFALRDIRVGTVDTWLLKALVGNPLAEAGNASRTLLFNLDTLAWDPYLLDKFGIPEGALAPIHPSAGCFGTTIKGLPIPAGLPVISVLADSHAALFFHTLGSFGAVKTTYGTGSSVMVASPVTDAPAGITTTLAWLGDAPVFAREGNILNSGATFSWASALLTGGDVGELDKLASQIESTSTVLVPAFSGLGSPYFDRQAKGIIAGITSASSAKDIARAALEAVANQVADVIAAIQSDGALTVTSINADGGPTRSTPLMQIQADLLGKPVHVSRRSEASCMGAALFGALNLDERISAEDWNHQRLTERAYLPKIAPTLRVSERRKWAGGVERSRLRPDPSRSENTQIHDAQNNETYEWSE